MTPNHSVSSLYPKYTTKEGQAIISQFHPISVLQLATTDITIPFYARTKLLHNFKSALTFVGLPEEFYGALEQQKAVISGSFVPHLLKQEPHSRWQAESPHDVDVYVGLGQLADFVHAINQLPHSNIIGFIHVRPTDGPAHDQVAYDEHGALLQGVQGEPFYNNVAIASMVRLTLITNGVTRCKLDIIESKSTSPLMPILLFDLSHLRCALTSEGLFIFHSDWHTDNCNTYVNPRVHNFEGQQGALNLHTQQFFHKYELRGFRILDPTTQDQTPGHAGHICYTSTSCPLTLRSTNDSGVQFVPFTDNAALTSLSETHPLLTNPILRWRHGGRCNASLQAWEESDVYEEQNNAAVL